MIIICAKVSKAYFRIVLWGTAAISEVTND